MRKVASILICLASVSGVPELLAQQPMVLRAAEVLELQQLSGQSQWASSMQDRLEGATWQFNPDGTFLFTMPNTRADLYPITGQFQQDGEMLVFSGVRTSRTGYAGTAFAQVEGRLHVSEGRAVITMLLNSGSNTGAVVNGQTYSGGSSSRYRVTLAAQ